MIVRRSPLPADRGRVLVRGQRDLLAVVAELELLAAGLPGQQRVVGILQAGRAGQVAAGGRVGEAEQVRGHVPVGVHALVAGLHLDARQPAAGGGGSGAGGGPGAGHAGQRQAPDLIGGRLRDPALEHHVLRRGRVLQQAEDVRLAHAERPGQIGGDLRHLRRGHHHRVRVDQVRLHGDGQRLAVRGGDVTAHGRQAHGLPPLVLGHPHVRAGFEALELDQPPGEQRHHDRDAQQRGPQPPPRVGPRPQYAETRRAGARRAAVPGKARPGGRPEARGPGVVYPPPRDDARRAAPFPGPRRSSPPRTRRSRQSRRSRRSSSPGRRAPRIGPVRPGPGAPRPMPAPATCVAPVTARLTSPAAHGHGV